MSAPWNDERFVVPDITVLAVDKKAPSGAQTEKFQHWQVDVDQMFKADRLEEIRVLGILLQPRDTTRWSEGGEDA